MGLLIRLAELLVVMLPLIGVLYVGIKALSSFTRRLGEASGDLASDSPAMPRPTTVENDAARWRAITRAVEAHERTDARWLEYELDAAKLLDFPVMTDMRDPLTTAFHKAKLQADFHKPLRAEDLLDDPDAAGHYLDAVRDYVTAFDTAEAEAQQRLARAQSLLRVASDAGATAQERERAYRLARTELDGLIVLPDRTRAGIERGIAGELDD